MKKPSFLLLLALPLSSCAQDNPVQVALHQWAVVTNPVFVAHAGDDRLFVVQQQGIIRIITDSMQVLDTPFMNITDRVNDGTSEQGLLGLAFDPDYAANGFFYVNYIHGNDEGTSRISRFQVSADPNVADTSSEVVLYTVDQPYWNHNGGCLQFGPDGYLYIGFGDGGSGNDPQNNAQNMGKALGKLVRIDVSQHNDTFLIPSDNPFAGNTDTLPEIWASGLRNPWRFSFDRLTGDLWIGDVGQNAWEEVDFWPAGDHSGPDFGWRCREGLVATPGVSQTGCAAAGPFVDPVAVFNHGAQGWCSVIGGHVYRGTQFPRLLGKYIFTDYCNGDFITFGENFDLDTLLLTNTYGFSSIGEDAAGELYVTDVENNRVYKLVDACPMPAPEVTFDGTTLTSTLADAWQWFLNGDPISGATAEQYDPQEDGGYQVLASFGEDCQLFSDTVHVLNTAITGNGPFRPAVYPQPASSMLTVRADGRAKPDCTVQLVDLAGHVVRTMPWPAATARLVIDVAGLPEGNYVMRARENGVLRWSRQVQVAR
ncbi:MAG: PQQ-dependent sugar dehydrogenase [Flavobacteriales bacterium]|nr:PQQ-dependent sugar dehydrogenase [Flavobacteriales bacterium]MBP9080246.1 PQQ-dependent sugar dehydrogenase [Flavobacteriales bacterium]